MALTKLLNFLWRLYCIIFQSHKNKNQSLIYYFMLRKCRRHQRQRRHLRAVFFNGLKYLGARLTGLRLHSARLDSSQQGHHMGGLMRIKNSNSYKRSNSKIVTIWNPLCSAHPVVRCWLCQWCRISHLLGSWCRVNCAHSRAWCCWLFAG